jgi:hypothetical protein
MSALATVAGAAKLLAPSAPPAPSGRTFAVRAPDGRIFHVEGGNTPEEAIEAVRRAEAFKKDAPSLGWLLGGALTLVACVFGGRHLR